MSTLHKTRVFPPTPQRPRRHRRRRRPDPRDRRWYYAAAFLALATGCAGFLLHLDGYHWFLGFAAAILAMTAGLDPWRWLKDRAGLW